MENDPLINLKGMGLEEYSYLKYFFGEKVGLNFIIQLFDARLKVCIWSLLRLFEKSISFIAFVLNNFVWLFNNSI